MSRSVLLDWALLTLLCTAGTALAGWWAVPVIAGVWTLALPRRGGVLTATAAGAAAWAILLLIAARSGRVDDVALLVASILGTKSSAVYALTLLYGALLAGAAALVARAFNPPSAPRSRGT